MQEDEQVKGVGGEGVVPTSVACRYTLSPHTLNRFDGISSHQLKTTATAPRAPDPSPRPPTHKHKQQQIHNAQQPKPHTRSCCRTQQRHLLPSLVLDGCCKHTPAVPTRSTVGAFREGPGPGPTKPHNKHLTKKQPALQPAQTAPQPTPPTTPLPAQPSQSCQHTHYQVLTDWLMRLFCRAKSA